MNLCLSFCVPSAIKLTTRMDGWMDVVVVVGVLDLPGA